MDLCMRRAKALEPQIKGINDFMLDFLILNYTLNKFANKNV